MAFVQMFPDDLKALRTARGSGKFCPCGDRELTGCCVFIDSKTRVK